MTERPLAGFRIGVTATRRAEEQVTLLERRGALVDWAPALSSYPDRVDATALRVATARVLASPVDLVVATTGIGITAWLDAAASWGWRGDLLDRLGDAELLARGPKTVGALRRAGLRERWAPASECLDDVLVHLADRDLAGVRIVVQEHGQSLAGVVAGLRRRGAEVIVVTVYRTAGPEDAAPLRQLVELVAAHALDAVTFTSAPAAGVLLETADTLGRRAEVVAAFRTGVLAACVGPVTADALGDVPTVRPERARLAALARLLETELPARRVASAMEAAGRRLLVRGDRVLLDGRPVALSPAPLAVLRALAAEPGHVVSRRDLAAALPGGATASEHAAEMAIARLRTAVGAELVQTVVKRGYRLAVG